MTATAARRTPSLGRRPTPGFEVRLDNFEGPFDLLLSLIAKHKLDITEVVAVAGHRRVHRPRQGRRARSWDLEQTTSFLLVASTLLDLKAARLLPQGDVEDEEDLALLEARDLLFARLLQYQAFKQVAAVLDGRLAGESRRHPRAVGLEERFADAAARGADRHRAGAVRRRWRPRRWSPSRCSRCRCTTSTRAQVSVREQAALVVERLRRSGTMTFRALCGDSPGHADHGGAVPVAARAVPRGRGRLRPGDPAGRADRALDRQRRRRVRDRRVRGRAGRAGARRRRARAETGRGADAGARPT